ncbi:hypothetical protein [Aurantibacter sp.]|uniref:hypothetical protein n=1 Tax=Aurantibacter sp. TaxID=2807103 RepID=UPI003267DCAD
MFTFFCGFAEQEKDSISIPIDENQILNTRSFNGDLNVKYNGEDFNYTSQEGEAQNLIMRFLQWFFNWVDESFGINIPPYTLELLEYLIYILMGGLIIYLFVRFFAGENFTSLFTKKATSILDINLSEEHIENVDLNALIKSAIDTKDYRLAVRYQYLFILKSLSEKGIIDWNYEKTNSDYQLEIEERQPNTVQTGFKDVSYLYDYIWYGEQEIDIAKYKLVETRFAILKNSIIK